MNYTAQFEYPKEIQVILRDSYQNHVYYGLDSFDCKYLKILQAKFGCKNSFHTIPDRVKMEMPPFVWHEKWNKFIPDEKHRHPVQLNQLELMIVNHSLLEDFHVD